MFGDSCKIQGQCEYDHFLCRFLAADQLCVGPTDGPSVARLYRGVPESYFFFFIPKKTDEFSVPAV